MGLVLISFFLLLTLVSGLILELALDVNPNSNNESSGEDDEPTNCFIYYNDNDEDGWGSGVGTVFCDTNKPSAVSYSRRNGDCNNANPTVYPNARELCDGLDNDCDGRIDNSVGFECVKGDAHCNSNCKFESKRTSPCKGALPEHSVLTKGNSLYTEKWNGINWGVVENDSYYFYSGLRDCTFICKENYYYDQGECKQYSCQINGDINYNLVNQCEGDNIGLTKNDRGLMDSIVGECTNEKKCEFVCKENYYFEIVGMKRTCLPYEYVCTGVIDANATIYPGDDAGLDQNLVRVLSDNNNPRKCEYFCTNNTILDNLLHKCVPNTFVCLNEELIDGNARVFVGDNINLDANIKSILVDSNSSRKCEFHCSPGFIRGGGVDENKCIPINYHCLGEIDVNAVMCIDSNSGLDKNIPNTLSTFCTGKKCEWICGEELEKGVGEDSNKCVPKSEYACIGEMDTNKMELYEGDADGLTIFDNFINILVFDNTPMKCEWKCREEAGYYLVDVERKGYDCVKKSEELFDCTGTTPPNALMYSNDDVGLTQNTGKFLSPINTQRKCEYECRAGYYLGFVGEEAICLPRTYSCLGSIPNSVLFIGDDVGLTQDLNLVLVKENTLRKCEMRCALNFKKDGNTCVQIELNEGVCGNAERAFTSNENFPGSFVLCDKGTPSITNPVLGSELGSITEWICILDKNMDCSATRVSSKYEPTETPSIEKNSILIAKTNLIENGKIELSLKCEKTTVVEVKIKDYVSGANINLNTKTFDCSVEEKKYELELKKESIPLTEKTFKINTAIMDSNTCDECELEYFMEYIPSPSKETGEFPLFFVIIGLVVIGLIGVIAFVVYQKMNPKTPIEEK